MCATKDISASIVPGSIIKSKSGHDSGSFYVVLQVIGNTVMIADGRRRKCEKPKRKNIKHIAPTTIRVSQQELATNKKIRRILWELNFNSIQPFV